MRAIADSRRRPAGEHAGDKAIFCYLDRAVGDGFFFESLLLGPGGLEMCFFCFSRDSVSSTGRCGVFEEVFLAFLFPRPGGLEYLFLFFSRVSVSSTRRFGVDI